MAAGSLWGLSPWIQLCLNPTNPVLTEHTRPEMRSAASPGRRVVHSSCCLQLAAPELAPCLSTLRWTLVWLEAASFQSIWGTRETHKPDLA